MITRSEQQDVIFAFLRAVNLGTHNKVPMKPLMAALDRSSFPPAAYLLASGNVVFTPPDGVPAPADLCDRLVDLIDEEFGVRTAAVLRRPRQLREHLAADPFTAKGLAPVYVSMWDGEPDPEGLAYLAEQDFSPDALRLTESAAIMGFDRTSHDAKLSNALVEKRLGVTATARNVNTLKRLLAKFAPDAR